ncbi:MAG TPA: hypothetical protein H9937_04200 [Candidatus Alistipes stercorigallinarum]|nr:hypothetical protein [Candidatus Alistipes stercorigallinarum]
MSNIKDLIRELAKGDGEAYGLICTVDSVDKEARTVDCTPIDEGAPLLGVNLQANQGSSFGVVSFPRVGSYVVVGFVAGGSAGVVLLTDDIESMEITTAEDKSRAMIDDDGVRINVGDDISAELTADGIVLNGGSLGGLVILEKIKSNLDQLKKYVETMKSAVSSGLKAVGMGTAANGATGATTFDGAMASAIINFEDMENEKVKQ